MEARVCPTCLREYVPNRPGQRFCRRNCGRWKHHTAITERMSERPPEDAFEAHLAGLIATDGYVERRKGREAPTGVAIKTAAAARPMLEHLAAARGRRICARSNGQFVLSFTDVPVCWKTRLPRLTPELERHYVRGLLDGDGCISAARAAGRAYPYVSLCFNPQREQWEGDFFCRFLDGHGIPWTLQIEKPTVAQVRCWSHGAEAIARLIYRGDGIAHPEKATRARELVARRQVVNGCLGWPPDLFRT